MANTAEDMITLTSAEQDSGGSNLSGATAPDAEDLVITNNSARGIYEATIGDRTAAGLVYNEVGSRVILLATSVLPEFRGKGVAARLIGGVLDELRLQGKTATVTCPFATAFVDAHPEYADVLDPAFPPSRAAGHEH
ncbi:Predicted acetyltransferase, GNAT superfamily [Micromonospora echinaurantiaca]|uniref:Predicted acetyltransferase, GNAT superfamily n=1 Tax=Micromonospora echinaurantiaca TaxID=47857 RepID=A0A1C5HDT4_9ACTN|nr:GNAT family N-acetyltransferase [Micromonospora echinaurantiaca]SCG44144.1 Predicted acetyltransferase, GNAT superfamily [Micromonospora echinaurantiaca]